MDDLVANAMEALSLWAEDEALPLARSIDGLKKDKSIARELARRGVSGVCSIYRE